MNEQVQTRRMKIGELAQKTGKTVRALHLYEELGLLKPGRSEGGFRLYGPDELARVYWIGKLQKMGFRLAQIQSLLSAVESSRSAPQAMDGVRELFQAKLEHTRSRLSTLHRLETDLAESLAYLEACRVCTDMHPAAAACTDCASERHVVPRPSLVAGIHMKAEGQESEGEAETE
jgi:DNA-binding transcriptional MerR regulator